MTISTSTTPDEQNEEDDNKDSCVILDCEVEATDQLDLPFGEYGRSQYFSSARNVRK